MWIVLIFFVLILIAISLPRVYQRRQENHFIHLCSEWEPITYTPPYTIDNLKFLLDITLRVSQSNCPNIPFSPPPGWEIVKKIVGPPHSTMYAYILQSGEQQLVAFTGTATASEWARDFQFFQIEIAPGIKVHSGFWAIYSSIREEIRKTLDLTKPIMTTGISLGGALATLLAYDLKIPVVSFASPRVGNNGFAESFVARVPSSKRIFNTEDVVPNLPPAIIGPYVYTHVGENQPFTLNLGSYRKNHVRAYVDYFSKNFTPDVKNERGHHGC